MNSTLGNCKDGMCVESSGIHDNLLLKYRIIDHRRSFLLNDPGDREIVVSLKLTAHIMTDDGVKFGFSLCMK